MNVWKIGSRWSEKGWLCTSVFSLFLKNKIVFLYKAKYEKFCDRVQVGDLIAIADGYKIKAIARVEEKPDVLENIISKENFKTTDYESQIFSYQEWKQSAIGCRVSIRMLSKEQEILYKKMGTFFHLNKFSSKIKELYENNNNLYNFDEEINLNCQLNQLFDKWKESMKCIEFNKGYTDENFIKDGFYPFYTKQARKILFIGREARDIDGVESYIELTLPAIKENRIGRYSINRSQFFSLMLRMSYGLCKGIYEWKKIPKANVLTKNFCIPGDDGFSYAFMNISKFSNQSKAYKEDKRLVNSFTDNSQDFIKKEIELLQPDIIVTMNLGEKLKLCGELNLIKRERDVDLYEIDLGDKKAKLADTFHFSAPGKSPKNNYFIPLLEILELINK